MPDFEVNYSTGSTLYITAKRLSDGDSHTITLTDNADGTYQGDMPESAGLGQYECVLYRQLGESPDIAMDILLYPLGLRIWSGSEFDFDKAVAASSRTYESTVMTFGGLRSG